MKEERPLHKLFTLWIGPLIIGGCLGIGYKLTHRVLGVRSSSHKSISKLFAQQSVFPGKGLKKLGISSQHKFSRLNAGFESKDNLETNQLKSEDQQKSPTTPPKGETVVIPDEKVIDLPTRVESKKENTPPTTNPPETILKKPKPVMVNTDRNSLTRPPEASLPKLQSTLETQIIDELFQTLPAP